MNRILISPIVSEKSIALVTEGRYTFKVAEKSNKPQIAQAISELYKVKVQKVNILRKKDEQKIIRGRFPGRIRGWKKAVITLKKGEKIPGFEEK